MAIASLVLAIIAALCAVLSFVSGPIAGIPGAILAVIGIITGVLGRKKPEGHGMATAGLVISIISLILCLLITIV